MTELVFPRVRRGRERSPRGLLLRWLVPDGDRVDVGQRLAEIRAIGEGRSRWVCASASGVLWHQGRAGEVFGSGEVLGIIEAA